MKYFAEKQRELVMQYLYCMELTDRKNLEDVRNLLQNTVSVSLKNILQIEEQAVQIFQKKEELDIEISKGSSDYAKERISLVLLSILRMILFESEYLSLDSTKAVQEGIRLAKKFSSEESGAFIHAILGEIFQGKKVAS